jgi:hypothetical protein
MPALDAEVGSQPPPPGATNKCIALWDTGATMSVISAKVAKDCGLAPSGMINTAGVHGIKLVNTYLVSFYLPNRIVLPSLAVSEGDFGGDIGALIGMDIISQGDFAVTNRKGLTWFSFRMPSLQRFDFVKTRVKSDSACTCGSGKLYRNCPDCK